MVARRVAVLIGAVAMAIAPQLSRAAAIPVPAGSAWRSIGEFSSPQGVFMNASQQLVVVNQIASGTTPQFEVKVYDGTSWSTLANFDPPYIEGMRYFFKANRYGVRAVATRQTIDQPFDPALHPRTYSILQDSWSELIAHASPQDVNPHYTHEGADYEVEQLHAIPLRDVKDVVVDDQLRLWVFGIGAMKTATCSARATALGCTNGTWFTLPILAHRLAASSEWHFATALEWSFLATPITQAYLLDELFMDTQRRTVSLSVSLLELATDKYVQVNMDNDVATILDGGLPKFIDSQGRAWRSALERQTLSEPRTELRVRSVGGNESTIGLAGTGWDSWGSSLLTGIAGDSRGALYIGRLAPDFVAPTSTPSGVTELLRYDGQAFDRYQLEGLNSRGSAGLVLVSQRQPSDVLYGAYYKECVSVTCKVELLRIDVNQLPSRTPVVPSTGAVDRERQQFTRKNAALTNQLRGRILLQVESRGEAWYVDPATGKKSYMADGPSAYQLLRRSGLGITNVDLAKIPEAGSSSRADAALVNRMRGRILLQVQSRGEAWYVNPVTGQRHYLKDGNAAYQIMRQLGLGISNSNLRQIEVGQ